MSSSYAKADGWLDWGGLACSLCECVCVLVEHMEGSCRDKCCLTGLSGPADSCLCEDRLLSSDSVLLIDTDLLITFLTFTPDLARPLPLTERLFFFLIQN